jgi:multidrug efflux pump subunit AcrA (membrane-fusion protein)
LLTTQDGTTSVMVARNDGKAHQQAVKAGFHDGDKVQILEGLQAGQKIVGNGAYGLPDNSKITAAEVKPDAGDKEKKE